MSHQAAGEKTPPEKISLPTRLFDGATVIAAVAGLAALAAFPLDWEDQAILGGALCALAWVLHRMFESRTATLTLVGVSMFTTARYLWWRFAETYSYMRYNASEESWGDLFFVGALLAAETYAFVILALGYLQSIAPLDRRPEPLPDDVSLWPSVDVFIPTYNEPLAVLKPTVLAALNIDWPQDKMRVWVLDDGCREEVREFAARCGADYLERLDSRYAKAGNLNHALERSSGELVAIFDCDHAPTRSFLQLTVGSFLKDPRLSMLQTPHHFYTPDPLERNLRMFRKIPNEGALFYGVVQKGNDFWNAASFAGSCAVLRRTALEEIGGIAVETVTEDAHTSLRLQKRGWNTAYLDVPQAAGLAAFSLRDHVNQRTRWARGLAQILRIEKPLWSRELRWTQRLCYFNSSIHFLYGLPRLVFLTAPLGFLLFERSNFYGYVLAILAYALPHLFLATMTNSRLQGRFRKPFWNEIFETLLAPFILIPTTLALISPHKGVFNVTPKSMKKDVKRYDWAMAAPFLVIAALNLVGIAMGAHKLIRGAAEFGTLAVNIAWACYSMMILGVVLAVAEESGESRSDTRVPIQAPTFATLPDGRRISGVTQDISYRGARIESSDAAKLARGDQTTVGFDVFGEEARITGRVVRADKWTAQVRFANLTLAQEEALTRLIFSRADAWADWNDSFPERYSPLASMARLAGLSLTGYVRALKGLFRGAAPEAPEPINEVSRAGGQPALPAILLLAAAASLGVAPLAAQPAEPPSATARAKAPFQERQRFSEIGVKQPIVLQGPEATFAFRFWSPLTKVVEKASLELHYQALAASGASASELAVSLNGVRVAEIALDGRAAQAAGREVVNLPADLFVGDNELSFDIEMPCEPDCRGTDEAAATVRIERDSELALSGERLPVALELRLLPLPFLDLSLQRAPEVGVVTEADAGTEALEAAGIAASWLGALADHRGVRLSAHVGELPPGHAIVVARSGSQLASRLGLEERTRPTLALLENPADPYGAVLALVGPDGPGLRRAAEALALGQYPGESGVAEIAHHRRTEARGGPAAPRWLDPSQPIPFTAFAPEGELQVFANSSLELYIRTPPDLDFGSARRLPLRLQYRVRDLPPGASAELTLLMNGVYVGRRSVLGADDLDQTVSEELFPVPVEALYPNSTLQVVFDAPPTAGGGYAALEILGRSELDLSAARRFAVLPRLDLFAQAGFPFTRKADLSETAVILGDAPGRAALSMYYNLLGLFSSVTGVSALGHDVELGELGSPVAGKDLLAIGEPGDPLFARWSELLTVTFEQPVLSLRTDSGRGEWMRRLSWGSFGRQRRALSKALRVEQPEAAVESAQLRGESRSLVAVAVSSPEAAIDWVEAMQDPASAGAVYGAFSFLARGKAHSFTTSPAAFYVGKPTLLTGVEFWLRRFLWTLPLLALLFAFALARVARARLERLAALRLQGAR